MTVSEAAIVGREHEQQFAEQLLEEAVAGPTACGLRDRRARHRQDLASGGLTARAEERGCLALRGSAAEFEQELPFGLVVDALDEYLGSLEPRAFSRLASEDLSEIAGVFPALGA